MNHMQYRNTVHAICDDFYSEIRGLDGSDGSWEEIYRLKDIYHDKCGGSRLSEELIIAVVSEFERSLAEKETHKAAKREIRKRANGHERLSVR